jgi:ABC-type multidrug transport system ATPase subunit
VDRVLVLQNGRIEQDGTPEQLMKVGGYFRDMMFRADGPLTGSASDAERASFSPLSTVLDDRVLSASRA